MSKTWGFFFAAQDMVLSHRAKFQLIINFFRVKAISTGLNLLLQYGQNDNTLSTRKIVHFELQHLKNVKT